MKIRSLLLAALGIVLIAPAALAAPADLDLTSVRRFSDGSAVAGSWSQLVRTDGGVSVSLGTGDLAAGDAVTVWWVIFNHPDECTAGGAGLRCGEPDLFDPDVAASVQWAAGRVVGGSGRYAVGSYLSEGDTRHCPFGTFLCEGLIDSREADVHLVVRTHGPKLAAFMPAQIMSFGAACGNVPAELGGGGPNTCMDLQFAAHETN